MSEKELNEIRQRRRKKDGVPNLEQGFTNCSEGRTGTFYYRDGDRILEFGWEYSGGPEPGGILISPDAFKEWFYPSIEPVEPEKQIQIKTEFIRMIKSQRGTPIFADPQEQYFSISGYFE